MSSFVCCKAEMTIPFGVCCDCPPDQKSGIAPPWLIHDADCDMQMGNNEKVA
jgi:hypothetical protein